MCVGSRLSEENGRIIIPELKNVGVSQAAPMEALRAGSSEPWLPAAKAAFWFDTVVL
jgi:hypothetical protein